MLPLPHVTPRDSHELWFRSSPHAYRSYNKPLSGGAGAQARRNGPPQMNSRALVAATAPADSLSALQVEERALRLRKQNIAMFGFSWIRPAGCSKTMLGMSEEEAEREEALLAAEMEAGRDVNLEFGSDEDGNRLPGGPVGEDGNGDPTMERDLDEDVPDMDDEPEGLIEEGEEDLEEDGIPDDDEDGYMDRDLDADVPEAAYENEDDDDDGDEDDAEPSSDGMRDLDDSIPSADEVQETGDAMDHDLDQDVPHAAEHEEWQHTDTDADFDDDDEENGFAQGSYSEEFRTSTSTNRSGLLSLSVPRQRRMHAQQRFLQRWSDGSDSFDSSGLELHGDESRRESLASNRSGRSGLDNTVSRSTRRSRARRV